MQMQLCMFLLTHLLMHAYAHQHVYMYTCAHTDTYIPRCSHACSCRFTWTYSYAQHAHWLVHVLMFTYAEMHTHAHRRGVYTHVYALTYVRHDMLAYTRTISAIMPAPAHIHAHAYICPLTHKCMWKCAHCQYAQISSICADMSIQKYTLVYTQPYTHGGQVLEEICGSGSIYGGKGQTNSVWGSQLSLSLIKLILVVI